MSAVQPQAERTAAGAWRALRAAMHAQRRGPPIRVVPRDAVLAASFVQQRLWTSQQLRPASAEFHLGVVHRLAPGTAPAWVVRGLEAVVARHEILRTTLHATPDGLVQRIAPPAALEAPLADLRDAAPQDREAAFARWAAQALAEPFALDTGPLLRVRLAHVDDDELRMLWVVHHAIFDGWSFDVMVGDFARACDALARGDPMPFDAPALQYADASAWQHARLAPGSEPVQALRAHWRARLTPLPPLLGLPGRRAATDDGVRPARECGASIAPALRAGLEALAAACGASLQAVLLAAFKVLLGRYGGVEDIALGSPVAGRYLPELREAIGPYLNTVVLRTSLAGAPPFVELLARVQRTLDDALAHQALPYDQVIEALNPPRDGGEARLFEAMFAYQNLPRSGRSRAGPILSSANLAPPHAMVDLALFAEPDGAGLALRLHYDAGRFDAPTVDALLAHYRTLLASIVADPQRPIDRLAVMDAAQREAAWRRAQGPAFDGGADANVARALAAQAMRSPRALAVIGGGERLDYATLHARAQHQARRLQAAGVAPGDRVGVCVGRSPAVVVAWLATLEAGAAYVPIAPDTPPARAARQVHEAGVRVAWADAANAARVPSDVRVLRVDEAAATADEAPARAPQADPVPTQAELVPTKADPAGDALACVMFTSGSTGEPKAVAVPHRGIVRLARGANDFRPGRSDVLLQHAPTGFDASTFEVWGALLNGATLVLADGDAFDLAALTDAIVRHRVSVLWLPCGLFELIVDLQPQALAAVRTLLVGGDVMSVAHAQRLLAAGSGTRLLNVYGPTENTTFTTAQPVTLPLEGPVPIGRPIAGGSVHVRDAWGEPVPTGAIGEAWLGGEGVALGYLNDPALSAARFVVDPLAPRAGRLYRSGDRVRVRADGTVEFVGRADDQVKIRGFRIEPAEVEQALRACEGVLQASVVALGEGASARRLVAFVVGDARAADAGTQATLAAALPAVWRPATVHRVDALPLTPEGKPDRRALVRLAEDLSAGRAAAPADRDDTAGVPGGGPAMAASPSDTGDAPALGDAPRGDDERAIAGLFMRLLDRPAIGRDDDFFACGGHSLLAVRLVAAIDDCAGRALPLARVFEQPTVAGIARSLRALGPDAGLVTLLAGEGVSPLFLVPGGHGGRVEMTLYATVFAGLSGIGPILGLPAPGLADGHAGYRTVDELARAHVATIRRRQPGGPYRIAGECVGCVLALEIARRLADAGERVAVLLLDGWCPTPAGVRHDRWVVRPRTRLAEYRHVTRVARGVLHEVLDEHARALRAMPLRRRPGQLRDLGAALGRVGRGWLTSLRGVGAPATGQHARAERRYVRVLMAARPAPYAGDVDLLVCDASAADGLIDTWRPRITGALRVAQVPGTHAQYLTGARAEVRTWLAQTLAAVR